MARPIKEKQYAARRNEILEAAQRMVYTKGYEQTSIQDILDEVHISKGAFYHYFDSKQALLEALIVHMRDVSEPVFLPVLQDPHLTAIVKFQRFFDVIAHWKTAQKDYILTLLRVWYRDDNVIVRQKVNAMLARQSTPMLTEIVQQGIREGVFKVDCPDQIGGVLMSLLQGLSNAMAELLLAWDPQRDDIHDLENRVIAYSDALERILGAPKGSLKLMDMALLKDWIVSPEISSELKNVKL